MEVRTARLHANHRRVRSTGHGLIRCLSPAPNPTAPPSAHSTQAMPTVPRGTTARPGWPPLPDRPEERRLGTDCTSPCSDRTWLLHEKTHKQHIYLRTEPP